MKLKSSVNNVSRKSRWSSTGAGFLKCVLRTVILLASMSGVESSMREPFSVPEPTTRVMLISLERGPLLLITNQSNTDVVLTKPTGYFEAYAFECNATFPIQWSYVGEGAPIMTGDVGRSFTNFFDPSTYLYHSSMTMYALEEQNSGRYVCRGIESQYQKVSAYLHLYVPGKNIFVSTMEKKIHVAPYKDQIMLPCGVSDPTVQINLYKGTSKGAFKRVDLEANPSITFNPRKGFRIQRTEMEDPFGKYLCVATANKKRVRVNVLPKVEGYGREKRETSNDIYGVSEALQFSYDNRYHRMLCCSASTIPPKLSFAGCTSIVDCEIKSGCFRENRCEAREGSENTGYYNNYIGLDPPGCTGHSLRDDPNGDFGLFLCADQTHTTLQYQPFLLNRGNLFMSFDTAPAADQVMTLTRATDEELFVGSETQFRCNTTRFFFGTGVRWAFERRNGELEFLEDSEAVSEAYFVNNHRRHTTLRIPHADIKAVVCAVPVWNSPTEWRMLSLPIAVSEIFHPPEEYTLPGQTQEPTYAAQTETLPPQQIGQGGYSGRHFRRRLSIPAQEPSPSITKVSYAPRVPLIPSPSQQSYLLPRNERQNSPILHQQQSPSYGNYVPKNLQVIPSSSNYAQSSSRYFYTNEKFPSESGGTVSPQQAFTFWNSTFDIASIL